MKTQIITYNLKDRGRKYRGKERNFNIRAIVEAVNGPETQERIKNRDMLGYYGHWVRLKFGMNPREGGIAAGKPSIVEPAFVTTHLRAHDDGTIEHQAEFLTNDPGVVASKLHAGRVGGFSSAIDEMRPEFFGFDYVFEPNYTTNRGYTLDDVSDMTWDEVEAAIYDEQLRGMMRLMDSVTSERDRTIEVIERLSAENEQLLSILASKGMDPAVLDSVSIMPVSVSKDPIERLRRDSEVFRGAFLPSVVTPQDDPTVKVPMYGRLIDRFKR